MKVGQDDWCSDCEDWMPFDENGRCIKCGTFINTKVKIYSWSENFGVEQKELENISTDF